MKKIDFNDYYFSKQYLLLFDVLIKQKAKNKDVFLEDINITPSSYRRAKMIEQNIGKNIVFKLCEYFNIKPISKEEIDKYQIYLNKIYYDYYYNLNNDYIYISGKLDELINEKNLFYPIFIMFKLLFNLVHNRNKSIIINENEYLYNEVIKYKNFFNDDLKDIFMHVEILYDKEFINKKINLDSSNGITYLIISNKCLESQKYIECLYYASKAKNLFLEDENYKRISLANINIMNSYCYLNNFEKYYNTAYTQFYSINGFNECGFIRDLTDKHLAISLIALKKYQEIIYFFKNKSDLTFTEMICLLIALYYEDIENYKKHYINVKEVLKDNDIKNEALDIINKCLLDGNKKILKNIKQGIENNLIYVLLNS